LIDPHRSDPHRGVAYALPAHDGARSGVRIGIAGWAMPGVLSDKSPERQSHLEQYAR